MYQISRISQALFCKTERLSLKWSKNQEKAGGTCLGEWQHTMYLESNPKDGVKIDWGKPQTFSFYLLLMYISSKKGLFHVNPHVNRWSHFWLTKTVLDPNYWPPSKYFSVLHPDVFANPNIAYEALWTQCDFSVKNRELFGILWTYFVNGKLSFFGGEGTALKAKPSNE